MSKYWDQDRKIVIFDEIHKFSRWKNLVKGIYDTQKEHHQFIVTGSARLDIFKKGKTRCWAAFFHGVCIRSAYHLLKRIHFLEDST